MLPTIEEQIQSAKFVPDLKKACAGLAQGIREIGQRLDRLEGKRGQRPGVVRGGSHELLQDHEVEFLNQIKSAIAGMGDTLAGHADYFKQRLEKLEAVVLEHAKLIDPAAFNEDPTDVEYSVRPAEAATDAPTEELTTEDTEGTEES